LGKKKTAAQTCTSPGIFFETMYGRPARTKLSTVIASTLGQDGGGGGEFNNLSKRSQEKTR